MGTKMKVLDIKFKITRSGTHVETVDTLAAASKVVRALPPMNVKVEMIRTTTTSTVLPTEAFLVRG